MKGHFVLFPHENVWCQNLKSKNKGAHATLGHTYSIKHAPFSSLIINYSLKRTRVFFLPTNSAVLSVPAWAAFTLAIPAGPVLIAAWVTRSLITGCAHPALLAATGASDTNAVSSAVRCTNLCGRGDNTEEGIWVEREKGEGKNPECYC